MVSRDVLVGPRLKLSRARRHLSEFVEMTDPLSTSLYELRVVSTVQIPQRERAEAMVHKLIYKSLQPVSQSVALVIGDVVHNLRSSLDHLATGIVNSKTYQSNTKFPMRGTREELWSDGKPIRDLALMEDALPGSISTIQSLRPHGSRVDRYWSFHKLDNDDKHNLIIPTIIVNKVSLGEFDNGGIKIGEITNTFSVDQNLDYVVWSWMGPRSSLKSIPVLDAHVTFGDSTPFPNESVKDALSAVLSLVSETLDAFETLIFSQA